MAPADQQTVPPAAPQTATTCANCGAAMAPDQRYCLSCGARRGAPRVPVTAPPGDSGAPPAAPAQSGRPADVSPLAAVIGIALLGGMLLIGVLIGRGNADDSSNQAATIQVGTGTGSTTASSSGSNPDSGGSDITSEWPADTDGYTVQLSSLPKSGATPEAVDAARASAVASGASAASVLDSDLYPSLPAGNYVIYSGVYDNRKEAKAGLAQLGDFPGATVIQVSTKGGSGGASDIPPAGDTTTPDLGSNPDGSTSPSDLALPPASGAVTESDK